MPPVRVPATSANLGPGLDVLGLALDLHLSVEIEPCRTGIEIQFSGVGQDEVALDGTNLVARAALHVFDVAGRRPPGLRLRVENQIPLARGLGSSAAAIVGGMVAADRLLGELHGPSARLAPQRLLAAAAAMEGHPDNVAPALFGGVTVTVGGPDAVHCHRFLPPGRLRLALAIPEFPLATERARQVMPRSVPLPDAVFNIGRAALMVAALMSGRWELLPAACQDRLHQPHRARLIPGLSDVIDAGLRAGARAAALSGAGPSVLAIVDAGEGGSAAPAVARAMAEAFADNGIDCRTIVAGIAADGALAPFTP